MRTLPLRARLTIWYTVVLLVALSLFGIDILFIQQRLGIRRIDGELDELHATVANVLRAEFEEKDPPREAAREALETVAASGAAFAVLDDHGDPLATRLNGLDVRELVHSSSGDGAPATVQTAGGAWRVQIKSQSFQSSPGSIPLRIVVASPLAAIRREQHSIQEAMLVAIPIALLLAGAGGLWLASIGLRPITEMARQASQIAPGGMEDLGDPQRSDELGQLARAFNGLLDRLRSALTTQRQFMADASHELRTPVSVVRTAADVALSRDHRNESDYRETLAIVNDQARRLGRLVEDMLVLARADAGGYKLWPVDLYLDEIVAECRRAAAVIADERGVAIDGSIAADVPFRGDESLLQRMVSNLLQNAVRHTQAGGCVGVDLQADEAGITIRVTDTGTGIRPEDQARIFDRFVQLDPARRTNGTGLGLPIARWIAEAHGGTLELESSSPSGSRFVVRLPSR